MQKRPADEKNFVLKDLDLEIPRGQITALIGGNGGKTILFNIISRFTESDRGWIIYRSRGLEIDLLRKNKPVASYKLAGLGIGRMFQDNHVFENMGTSKTCY